MAKYLELTLQNAHLLTMFSEYLQRFLKSKSFRGNKLPSPVCSFHMSHTSPPYSPHRPYLQFWILWHCAQPLSLHPQSRAYKKKKKKKKTKQINDPISQSRIIRQIMNLYGTQIIVLFCQIIMSSHLCNNLISECYAIQLYI